MRKLLIVALLLPVGCSSSEEEYVYEPHDFRPTVDESQPPEVQEMQDAIIRGLGAIHGGYNIEDVPERHRDIRVDVKTEEFFADGALLHRIEWNGPPSGNEFPVKLTIKKNEPGLPEVAYERIFTVTKEEDGTFVLRQKNTNAISAKSP